MDSAQEIHKIANEMRSDVLKMVFYARAGHVAGPLSSADLLAFLFLGKNLKFDPKNPLWEERDRFVLSCGHYCPILYSALARSGYFEISELDSFMRIGSRLPGHPERSSAPGVEVSAGPLGQGVSVAVGMALAVKMKYGYKSHSETPRVVCLLSDGELQEGQTWEAFNFATRRQLDNLIFIVDRNKIQIENYISQLATYGDISGRFESFGLHTLETDGNDIAKLTKTFEIAKTIIGGPTMIVMNTDAGKGVTFMENDPTWHDKVPTKDELKLALTQLGVSYDNV